MANRIRSNNPLLSILVPVYNIQRYIGMCIESIIRQSYSNIEIIVVDDGSTDRSGEICDLYAQKDSRIRVIHKVNGGLVSARKAAMQAAHGEYIGYVDGDDWIDRDYYLRLMTVMQQNNADVVIAGFSRDLFSQTVHISNAIGDGLYTEGRLNEFFSSMISFQDFFRHGVTTYLWNKLFKKDKIYDIQLAIDNEITIGEDAGVTYPTLLRCEKICLTENFDYHYRQREDSMLKKSKSFTDELKGLQKLYKFLIKSLSAYDGSFNLISQVKQYLLSTCIIRSGGILSGSNDIYPFTQNIQDKNVILCGAGTFGQQLYNRIREHNFCTIVDWIDDDYWEYRRCCLDVDPIEIKKNIQYDYVLVCVVDSNSSKILYNRLVQLGIPKEKLLTVYVDRNKISQYLDSFIGEGAK